MSTKTIRFKCPSCRTRIAAGQGECGSLVLCPLCSARVRVPRARWLSAGVVALTGAVALAGLTAGGVWFWVAEAGRGAAARGRQAGDGRGPGVPSNAVGDQPAAVPSDTGRGIAELLEENRRLAEEHGALSTRFGDLANWVLTTFKGKFPLPDRLVSHLQLTPVNEDYALHPDVVELLHVTPSEISLVNDALAFTRNEILTRETAGMSVLDWSDDRVTLYAPPFEEEGTRIREDLYQAVEAALGGARFDRFVEVSDAGLHEAYHYFGQAMRTMTFEIAYADPAGQVPYLLIRDGWVIPDGASKRSTKVAETAVVELPKMYQPYRGWLPESFSLFSPQ
jgi:hypothetical protein